MGKNLVFTEQEIRFLQELSRQRVKFLIVGLSAANLQGAPAVTQDIDLWFRNLADPGIHRALAKVGGMYVAPTAFTSPMLAGKAVALFDIVLTMDGLCSFDKEYRSALKVRLGKATVRVLPLARIIASKRAANRPKDKLVLPVLEDALLATRTLRPEKAREITKGVSGRKA